MRTSFGTSRLPSWLHALVCALAMTATGVRSDSLSSCHDLPSTAGTPVRLTSTLALLSAAAYLNCPPNIDHGEAHYEVTRVFPGTTRESSGLAYVVYRVTGTGEPVSTVIAFRGTESSWRDWVLGNVPILRLQSRRALRAMDRELEAVPVQQPVLLTGHSLGGGIATTLWRYHPERTNMRAFAFNSSPLLGCLWFDGRRCQQDSRQTYGRWSNSYETGDPTRRLGNLLFPHRWNWLSKLLRGVDRDCYYRKLNFSAGGALSSHSIDNLARSLATDEDGEGTPLVDALEAINCHQRAEHGTHVQCAESVVLKDLAVHFPKTCHPPLGAQADDRHP